MPGIHTVRLKKIYLKWDLKTESKHGLFLYVVYEDQDGNDHTVRQILFSQLFNPEELNGLVAPLLQAQFQTPFNIKVSPNLHATLTTYSEQELELPSDSSPEAGQFRWVDGQLEEIK